MILTDEQRALQAGDEGRAASFAARIIVDLANAQGATKLIPIAAAHVDSALFHGRSSLDFVESLIRGDARVRVPTTLNVGGLDLAHPEAFLGSAAQSKDARSLMEAYVQIGCMPTFTCAPYQLPSRPAAGVDVAWAESNAIAFGNSVIGLRTNRYGDLVDVCAAITGFVPYAGLHVPENRLGSMTFEVDENLARTVPTDLLPALLGHHVGRSASGRIPVITGLDPATISEDWCKAFGAAAASSGGVAMFHIVGVTPEAQNVDEAMGGRAVIGSRVTADDLMQARSQLTTAHSSDPLGGVTFGTPHLSRAQFVDLARAFEGNRVAVPTFASTSRLIIAAEGVAAETLRSAGVTLVSDTCTYVSPIMGDIGVVMTNSAKWAYYAPANLGTDVILASQHECVASAISGRIEIWDSK